jgi:hypothetical protein
VVIAPFVEAQPHRNKILFGWPIMKPNNRVHATVPPLRFGPEHDPWG